MRKLAWFSFSFGGAAAIYVALQKPLWGFLLGGVCAVVFIAALLKKKGWSPAAVAALGLAAGLLWSAAFDLWLNISFKHRFACIDCIMKAGCLFLFQKTGTRRKGDKDQSAK